ncbi:hypothetical protein ACJBSM_12140, partial [Streptococcus suis]
MDRTEQARAASRKPAAAAEHERAQAYRGLAWDIGSAMESKNPELAGKIDSELGRIEAMKFENAKAGMSSAQNSAMLA